MPWCVHATVAAGDAEVAWAHRGPKAAPAGTLVPALLQEALDDPSVDAYHAATHRAQGLDSRGGDSMTWETPAFVEVKMDAEINSYQDDFDREQDDRF